MEPTNLEQLLTENIRLLKLQESREKRRLIFRMVYYLAILALLFGAYTYIKPFIGNLQEAYTSFLQTLDELNNPKAPLQSSSKSTKGK